MIGRNIILILTLFSLIVFWGCERYTHQGTDPDKVLPQVEWIAMHVGGDPWGLQYTPQKTFYWGNFPVSSCDSTEGCSITMESMPGKISIVNDRNYVIEVKCFDPQSNGIKRVIGNYENPRYHCLNFDYYLDNKDDNPNDDPGLGFTAGSIHEMPFFFREDERYTAYGDDYLDYEFGYGLGNDARQGFSDFHDDGIDASTEQTSYDEIAGDNIWTSYLDKLSNRSSTYRNFNSFDEIQYLIVRSYYDESKGKMCNWRLFFYAEDTTNFSIQGILPDLWLEITE